MEEGDRKAFDGILAEIFGALDKPLGPSKSDAFWKGLQRMGIVEFARCRDHILAKLETDEPPKSFGVGHVWEAKRAMRAKGPDPKPTAPESDVNPWQVCGDKYLRGYLTRVNVARYGRAATAEGMRNLSREKFPNADASEDFVWNIQRLIAAKNAWVADMIDVSGGSGPVDPDIQRAVWKDYFDRAEAEIASRMQAEAA